MTSSNVYIDFKYVYTVTTIKWPKFKKWLNWWLFNDIVATIKRASTFGIPGRHVILSVLGLLANEAILDPQYV